MGTGNSTTPSIMFMLEPAVATVSICLPAISALVTRGLKQVPTSYIRGTWSKRPASSKDTSRASTSPKFFSPAFKSLSCLVSRRDTADSKRQQLLPVSRHNSIHEKDDVNGSACGGINSSEAINIRVDRPSSTFSLAKVADERSPYKSLELERRVRRYYQQSDFPRTAPETP